MKKETPYFYKYQFKTATVNVTTIRDTSKDPIQINVSTLV